MKWILFSGLALVAAGVVVMLLGVTAPAVALIATGVVVILIAVFRRYGRPGDFSRSGWNGQ